MSERKLQRIKALRRFWMSKTASRVARPELALDAERGLIDFYLSGIERFALQPPSVTPSPLRPRPRPRPITQALQPIVASCSRCCGAATAWPMPSDIAPPRRAFSCCVTGAHEKQDRRPRRKSAAGLRFAITSGHTPKWWAAERRDLLQQHRNRSVCTGNS